MTATQARKTFYAVIDAAEKPGVAIAITHEGIPKVVVMSFEEYEGWQETMEIMADPELVEEIRQTKEDFEKGRMDKFITWEEMQKRLGWKLADKSHKKYVHSSTEKRSKKKSSKNR